MKVILNSNDLTFIKKNDNGSYTIYCDKRTLIGTDIAVIQAEAITFAYKPYLNEIKNAIIEYYNTKISNKLVNGFVWDGLHVSLSKHDQLNYKSACDLAIQTSGKSLPATFKFTNDDNENVYYSFNTSDEILEFWTAAYKYINDCLIEGYKEKEAINWDVYKL